MATTTTKTATASTAYGEELDAPITFSYSYASLTSMDEVPSDERPTEKQMLNLVNSLRNATARNKAQAVAFDNAGIKAPSVDPAESRRKILLKILIAEGATVEQAEKMADNMLGAFRK
jgi:hypothetical protein